LFKGELDEVGRSAIGAKKCGEGNDGEDDKCEYALEDAWALWLSYVV
jgi:hypothetical protein